MYIVPKETGRKGWKILKMSEKGCLDSWISGSEMKTSMYLQVAQLKDLGHLGLPPRSFFISSEDFHRTRYSRRKTNHDSAMLPIEQKPGKPHARHRNNEEKLKSCGVYR